MAQHREKGRGGPPILETIEDISSELQDAIGRLQRLVERLGGGHEEKPRQAAPMESHGGLSPEITDRLRSIIDQLQGSPAEANAPQSPGREQGRQENGAESKPRQGGHGARK